MPYQYSELAPDELRLLKPIFNNEADGNGTIHFDVLTTFRANAPAYTALSYTWGTEKPTKIIYLDGYKFNVRPNLWTCLRHLTQHLTTDPTPLCLWIDAICIDQNSVRERTEQVRHMDKTYTDAAYVSAWLGPAPLVDGTNYVSYGTEQEYVYEHGTLGRRASVLEVVNRAYWTRLWIVQEFLLAKDIRIFAGAHRLHWFDLRRMVRFYLDSRDDDYEPDEREPCAASRLLWQRYPQAEYPFSNNLFQLLVDHYESECTDARDRVFLMLGLLPDEERALLARFFPDYSMSEPVVVAITLAHLTQYLKWEVRETSEYLWQGLGVTTKARRKPLLDSASRLDYFDAGVIRTCISFHMSISEIETNPTLLDEQNSTSRSTPSWRQAEEEEEYVNVQADLVRDIRPRASGAQQWVRSVQRSVERLM